MCAEAGFEWVFMHVTLIKGGVEKMDKGESHLPPHFPFSLGEKYSLTHFSLGEMPFTTIEDLAESIDHPL